MARTTGRRPGGAEEVSTQQLTLVNLGVKTKLLLDSIDSWLLQRPTLVNARKRTVLTVVLQRSQLADSLARYMTQLGLERKAKQLPSLPEYLAKKNCEQSTSPPDDEGQDTVIDDGHREGLAHTPASTTKMEDCHHAD